MKPKPRNQLRELRRQLRKKDEALAALNSRAATAENERTWLERRLKSLGSGEVFLDGPSGVYTAAVRIDYAAIRHSHKLPLLEHLLENLFGRLIREIPELNGTADFSATKDKLKRMLDRASEEKWFHTYRILRHRTFSAHEMRFLPDSHHDLKDLISRTLEAAELAQKQLENPPRKAVG